MFKCKKKSFKLMKGNEVKDISLVIDLSCSPAGLDCVECLEKIFRNCLFEDVKGHQVVQNVHFWELEEFCVIVVIPRAGLMDLCEYIGLKKDSTYVNGILYV